jgi:hypothetical protein
LDTIVVVWIHSCNVDVIVIVRKIVVVVVTIIGVVVGIV